MSIWSLPVYDNGIMFVPYIAKYTCDDNYVATPRNPLPL